MREMRWSWRDLQECPIYVRRYVWDLTLIRRAAIAAHHEAASKPRGGPGA